MERGGRDDAGPRGSDGLPPLVVRQAIADAIAGRLPLAAHAVLAGSLTADQLFVVDEGG
jgi:hypothetical protein